MSGNVRVRFASRRHVSLGRRARVTSSPPALNPSDPPRPNTLARRLAGIEPARRSRQGLAIGDELATRDFPRELCPLAAELLNPSIDGRDLGVEIVGRRRRDGRDRLQPPLGVRRGPTRG
jgi:hypothetical protein